MMHQQSHLQNVISGPPWLHVRPTEYAQMMTSQQPESVLSPYDESPSTRFVTASRRRTHSWTEEEDHRLVTAVHKFGTENWTIIASQVGGGRTRAQCSQRWLRALNPIISKVSWTENEDQLLIDSVRKFGAKGWAKIASIVGNRCDVQCRYRYKQLVKNKVINEQGERETVPHEHPPRLPSILELISKTTPMSNKYVCY